jgi:hypothetical protein
MIAGCDGTSPRCRTQSTQQTRSRTREAALG